MFLKGSIIKRLFFSLAQKGSILPSSRSLQPVNLGKNSYSNASLSSATEPLKLDYTEAGLFARGNDTKKSLTANFAVRANWSSGAYGYFTAGGSVYWNNGEENDKALAVMYRYSGERVIYSAVECPQNRNKQHLAEFLSCDKREHEVPTKESLLEWIKPLKLNNGARKAHNDGDASP